MGIDSGGRSLDAVMQIKMANSQKDCDIGNVSFWVFADGSSVSWNGYIVGLYGLSVIAAGVTSSACLFVLSAKSGSRPGGSGRR